MKKQTLKLQTKIILLIILVIFISLSFAAGFVTRWSVYNVQDKVEDNVMNIAQIIANSPSIIEALDNKDPNGIIKIHVARMLKSVDKIDFIVVSDMKGIRYSHPIPSRIGKTFVGGDEKRVLQGEVYISEAIGTLGKSLRSFVPIYNVKSEQIGFVVVGTLAESINKAKQQVILRIVAASFYGLLIGIIIAFLLSDNIKKSLLGFEPNEISQMYLEKKGMLDAIHEGIIAIDENENITLCNDSAIEILNIKNKDVVGKKVNEVFPTSRLVEVLKTGYSEYNKEQVINNTIIMTNRVPIFDDGKVVGAIATFRDKTLITRLAEEITGVKQIIESLRANNHEFMNKLHVILGLIQLGDLEEAKKYIMNVTEKQQELMNVITNKIKDPKVGALIIGKFSRAKEQGVKLIINENTMVLKEHGVINSNNLITIIGNLIENAIEAVGKSNNKIKEVKFSIIESKDLIKIEVIDTGIGIEDEHLPIILKRGFTTKEESGGVGLSLVKETVEIYNGNIDISSRLNVGTKISILLRKEKDDD